MKRDRNRVCPVELAGSLDTRLRRWLQNPSRLLAPFIKEGMSVLDAGCGPGFFSIDMAEMVGPSGRVIAADLQEGMLEKVGHKIRGTELERRVTLHKCQEDRIGLMETVDFALAFYVVHEIPHQAAFFEELASIVKPCGFLLVVEPPFHVSKMEFEETIGRAISAGFTVVDKPRIFPNKTVLLRRHED